ncbi:MSHA biogenesis protein MshA [Pseudidiomarina aquimaris]|uniref:MSHA biogenesis protein MshA n=1 Tax=Pseudidiomarina aquimaris TaxID=641841 RepID=A0A432XNE1_9GAMM|nr:type II secretion system protein [Pseudidiomarina aquimaris]RUO50235.1 MSHA biogenesis protein MshA [Pseudidiomarina aquimaris]
MKQQKGFTLIELIIVIVVLGILAVTAAPQFINFQSDARESTVKGAQASIQGAMQLVYAKSLIDGSDAAATGTVVTENDTIDIIYGYPAAEAASATTGGIAAAAGLGTDWASSATGATPNVISFTPGATVNATCAVVYTEATDASTPASVTVDTSGC